MPDLTMPASIIFRSAIYGLRRGPAYLYIGKSLSVLRRIKNHHVMKERSIQPKDMIDVWFCDPGELDRMERSLIAHYNPLLNILKYEKDGDETKQKFDSFKEAAMAKDPKWKGRIPSSPSPRRILSPEQLQHIADHLFDK